MNENSHEKQNEVPPDVSKSFRLMWDTFPHPVLLLQKNRTIVDSNKLARDLGVPAGVKCRDISPYPEKCKNHCLADKALASGVTEQIISRQGNKLLATYWIPLKLLQDDLYLHFVMDFPDAMIQEQGKML
ncbi:MAG: hypothetical protein Q8O28_03895 [Smithellaceae bacterium]|nr:hypothetical protein [Smithellaceae bacterium]